MLKILLLSIGFLASFGAQSNGVISQKRFQLLSGLKRGSRLNFSQGTKRDLNRFKWSPSTFLSNNSEYILPHSKVLDLSLGDGHNSVFMAKRGHKVSVLESDSNKIKKAKLLAKEFGVKFNEFKGDLENYNFPENSFDAIIVFQNLSEKYHRKIMRWLRPGGIFVYEGLTSRQKLRDPNMAVKNLIKAHNLLNLFKRFQVLKYQEPLHLEKYSASIILKKPATLSF
jgi:SAM-dependent methyltransferase